MRGDGGQRTEANSARLPDVIVVQQENLMALRGQPAVLEVRAQLVAEIVSESSKMDDYLYKLAEYDDQGIPEYWVVDYLGLGTIQYLDQVNGTYQVSQYRGGDRILSATFSDLVLTADQVFRGEK